MVGPAAKGRKLFSLAAALLVAAAALGLPTPAAASRYAPTALEPTLAAPAVDLAGAAGDVDRSPAFVLLTAADRQALAAGFAGARARRLGLFPELAPGSSDPSGWKLASGVSAWWLEANVWQFQEIPSEPWWATEMYAFVGWAPHMGTDPMGLEIGDEATTMMMSPEEIERTNKDRALIPLALGKMVVGAAARGVRTVVCPLCVGYEDVQAVRARAAQSRAHGGTAAEGVAVALTADTTGATPFVQGLTGDEAYGRALTMDERVEQTVQGTVGLGMTIAAISGGVRALGKWFEGAPETPVPAPAAEPPLRPPAGSRGVPVHQEVVAEYKQQGWTDLGFTHRTTDLAGPSGQQVSVVTVDLAGSTVSRPAVPGRTHPLTSRIASKAWRLATDPVAGPAPRILHVELYGPAATADQVAAVAAAQRRIAAWQGETPVDVVVGYRP